MLAITLCVLAATAQKARSTYEFTLDPATTSLVLSGSVLQEKLNCSHQLITNGSTNLGPMKVCPSGSPLIPFEPSGTLQLVLVRDGLGGIQASFASGRMDVADFAGVVGSCGAPVAQFAVSNFLTSMVSGLFPVNPPGSPVAGCSVGDNYSGSARMLVLTGHAEITAPGVGVQSFELDCSTSAFTPTCGSLQRQGNDLMLVATFGVANPLKIPWSYEVDIFNDPDFCPPIFLSAFKYLRFSGNLSVSGTLRGRLTRVMPRHPDDPDGPNCPPPPP